jgi:hypothetical protein
VSLGKPSGDGGNVFGKAGFVSRTTKFISDTTGTSSGSRLLFSRMSEGFAGATGEVPAVVGEFRGITAGFPRTAFFETGK